MSKDRKTKPKKKLSLKKESLRTLSPGELSQAAGGLTAYCGQDTNACASDTCPNATDACDGTLNCINTVYATGYCKTQVATGYCTF